jgi:hypothetical protein
VCLVPGVDTERVELAAEDGWCEISGEHDDGMPRVLHPVAVWRERLSVKQRAALARLRDDGGRSGDPATMGG